MDQVSFWNKLRGRAPSPAGASIEMPVLAPVFETEGALYPSVARDSLTSALPTERAALAYLRQLEEEGFITPLVDNWLLPWEQVYEVLQSDEHRASSVLLGLPSVRDLRLALTSSGSLSDPAFTITIQGWESSAGVPIRGTLSRQGAVYMLDSERWLLPAPTWKLIRAVQDLHRDQQVAPGEKTNQLGWATIRKLAKRANAHLDGFLDRTVVVRPESLRLDLDRRLVGNEQVVEVTPRFDEQPVGWLASFERQQQVQDRYVVAQEDGGVTHVLVPPDVKAVLSEVRAMPARRVAGHNAALFLKNPFAYLGPEASSVLDPEEYDAALERAGIHFYRFAIKPVLTLEQRIDTVVLVLTAPSEIMAPVEMDFNDPVTMGQFVTEVGSKFVAGLACAFWRGYELELGSFGASELSHLEEVQQRWRAQAAGQELNDVLDLAQYGDRVIGIGRAEKVASPYLQKGKAENWLPAELLSRLGLDGELLSRWETSNHDHYQQFLVNIEAASANGQATARLPGPELDLELLTARRIATLWGERFKQRAPGDAKEANARDVLLVAGNIDELDYKRDRGATIRQGLMADPELPYALLPSTSLRGHQLQGVGWLQHLYRLSPHMTSGCVLADDMGLGKTLQLLSFIAWCMETDPDGAPVLIVAPVSLLDNWEREMRHFLHPRVGEEVLKLYGRSLQEARLPKGELPPEVRAHGIQNLLRFGWRRNKRIVLTTYETLRDQEFSLARQAWSVVICDEAQKIKNPAARVTQATKALQARFRIACTGTPVENSLTDLWCLYDWIQPGLLGSLNEFGAKFRRPIENKEQQDAFALNELRTLIEPQLLRRTKQDVAKDLPAKIEDAACKTLPMSRLQVRLYRSEVGLYHDQRAMQEHLGEQSAAMLGLLHKLKMICAHPHALRPEGEANEVSPKLRWTMEKLKAIQAHGEKAIIFTELRDIQRALQFAILDAFGFMATIINGDTNSSGERGPSRQNLIDAYQEAPGFGVIILSTTAVGFGVNVQAANHVIHFTRPWNPAKEDQATDRAYRIGQQRDVYVYYPTVVGDGMVTFEQTLDLLLSRKRALATDMLNGTGDIEINEFAAYLTPTSSLPHKDPKHEL